MNPSMRVNAYDAGAVSGAAAGAAPGAAATSAAGAGAEVMEEAGRSPGADAGAAHGAVGRCPRPMAERAEVAEEPVHPPWRLLLITLLVVALHPHMVVAVHSPPRRRPGGSGPPFRDFAPF